MSIIHDALKKIQTQSPGANNLEPAPAAATSNPNEQASDNSTDTTKKPLIILMAVVLSITVVIILAILYKLASDTTQHAKPAFTLTAISAWNPIKFRDKAKSLKTQKPETLPPEQIAAGLRIEGVMNMGGKMTTLINGDVYEEGQRVNDKIISEITFDSVTILDNGKKKTLRTKP